MADALSRNNLHLFFANHPQAQSTPSPIPSLLLDLLVHTKPDWTSPSWSSTFNAIFTVPSQRTQYSHTHQASDDMLLSAHRQDSSHSQHQSLYSVNLPPSLASNSLSTDQLNATCQLSDFSKSCILSHIPLNLHHDSGSFLQKQKLTAHCMRATALELARLLLYCSSKWNRRLHHSDTRALDKLCILRLYPHSSREPAAISTCMAV